MNDNELRLTMIINTFRDRLIELDEQDFINWVEKTSITSYFFIKLGVIWDYDLFIKKFMFNNNIGINEFLEFILQNYKNIEFINVDYISQNLKKTLRMTINSFI